MCKLCIVRLCRLCMVSSLCFKCACKQPCVGSAWCLRLWAKSTSFFVVIYSLLKLSFPGVRLCDSLVLTLKRKENYTIWFSLSSNGDIFMAALFYFFFKYVRWKNDNRRGCKIQIWWMVFQCNCFPLKEKLLIISFINLINSTFWSLASSWSNTQP